MDYSTDSRRIVTAGGTVNHLATGRNGKPIVTTCKHGHCWDELNTRIRADGTRACIACDRERKRAKAPERKATDLPYIDGEGLIDVLAAVVKLAISDYLPRR